jgi:HlyD family secretion protein
MRSQGKWFWVSGVVLAALGGGWWFLRAATASNVEVDPSKIALAETGDLARAVVATGKIQPRTKVEVKSKASGIVRKIHFEYGSSVKAGQVLVELDKEELQAQAREATANLQAATAAEESAAAALDRYRAEAEAPELPFLKSGLERARRLFGEGLVAPTVLDDADRLWTAAIHKQSVAKRSINVASADLSRAKAQLAQARAMLDRAEENLRNATIVSPMDGVILSRNVEVGDAVSSILVMGSQSTLVMTVGDVGDVFVLGKVDQADIGKVSAGQQARIVVESFKDRRFVGEVTRIAPLGVEKDNVTTFEVRVSIRNPGGELKTNMSANAELILEERRGVVNVPEAAVIYDEQRRSFVEVPAPTEPTGKKRVPVTLGISNGVRTQVMSGVSSGQKVILQ